MTDRGGQQDVRRRPQVAALYSPLERADILRGIFGSPGAAAAPDRAPAEPLIGKVLP